MAWIEFHDTISDHPKTVRLAHDLGIEAAHAVGLLGCLWTWTIRFKPEGRLTGLSEVEIANACKWGGKPGPLVQALKDHGWLDRMGGRGKTLKVHKWEFYTRHWRKMQRDAARKRRGRGGGHSADDPRNGAVTGPQQPDQTGPDRTGPTQPGRFAANLALLSSVRVTPKVAKEISTDYEIERVFDVVRAAVNHDSPGGYAVEALRNGWEVPEVFKKDPIKAMQEVKEIMGQ